MQKSWGRRLLNVLTFGYLETALRERHYNHSSGGGTCAVNEQTALSLTAYYAGVRVIAETMASLPFPVYRRLPQGGKDRAYDHPVYQLLNVSPNGEIGAMQWRESSAGHLNTWGNSYSEIEATRSGEILNLWPLLPNQVTPGRSKSGAIEYKVEGQSTPIPADKMLHFAGLGFDGLVGYSPVRLARKAIAHGLALEQFGLSFFENGARPGGIITSTKNLSPTAQENLRQAINDVHGGPENYAKWMFLQDGTSAQLLSVPNEDAQFLQSRAFSVTEIARILRVPPHLIGDLTRSTFSNIEHQSIDFVTHTLLPHCRRMEQEICRKLFTPAERQVYFAEHLFDALLRGDTASRYAAYATARQNGWLNVDEIRAFENMNPLPDGAGQIYLNPLNMAPPEPQAGDQGDEPAPASPEPTDNQDQDPGQEAVINSAKKSLNDSLGRMQRREFSAIRRAAKKPDEFLTIVDEFYAKHEEFCANAIRPSFDTFVKVMNGDSRTPESVAAEVCDRHREQLLEMSGTVTPAGLVDAVEKMLAQWKHETVA